MKILGYKIALHKMIVIMMFQLDLNISEEDSSNFSITFSRKSKSNVEYYFVNISPFRYITLVNSRFYTKIQISNKVKISFTILINF